MPGVQLRELLPPEGSLSSWVPWSPGGTVLKEWPNNVGWRHMGMGRTLPHSWGSLEMTGEGSSSGELSALNMKTAWLAGEACGPAQLLSSHAGLLKFRWANTGKGYWLNKMSPKSGGNSKYCYSHKQVTYVYPATPCHLSPLLENNRVRPLHRKHTCTEPFPSVIKNQKICSSLYFLDQPWSGDSTSDRMIQLWQEHHKGTYLSMGPSVWCHPPSPQMLMRLPRYWKCYRELHSRIHISNGMKEGPE